eukprot:11226043-Lingulodinium_polyedra.AAC.1
MGGRKEEGGGRRKRRRRDMPAKNKISSTNLRIRMNKPIINAYDPHIPLQIRPTFHFQIAPPNPAQYAPRVALC